jgi:hypothetical protein
MSTGKAAARDTRYGRRGGGWAEPGAGSDLVSELDIIRRRATEAHRLEPTKNPPWPETYAISDDRGPHTDAEWDGAARMAWARKRANVPLNGVDREALERAGLAS